jgi:3-deoxy-manno-octulosonate cytidylyltransferase (CMP-KDO synthetase)
LTPSEGGAYRTALQAIEEARVRAIAVIPARFGSTRFPGKPLVPLLGRPMIAWVVEAALRARSLQEVWVATDHEVIGEAAQAAGAQVALTPAELPSGTDRAAEVARRVEADVYVNLQGDEPLMDPHDVDALVGAFEGQPKPAMATLARALREPAELWNPDVVKVVCRRSGEALYFSRAPIPFYRDAWSAWGAAVPLPAGMAAPRRHLGVYAFTRESLLAFPVLPRGVLEAAESLEQLRALEAGWTIRVLEARGEGLGVDRAEDVSRAEEALRTRTLEPIRRSGTPHPERL